MPQKIVLQDALFRQPILDLFFDVGQSCRASLWVPELILLGNTDCKTSAVNTFEWTCDSSGHCWSYDHLNQGQPLSFAAQVRRIANGWDISLSIRNQSVNDYSDIVATTCLQLPASCVFEDPQWQRTFYRSGGEFLSYAGRECDGGLSTYRMSLVKGLQQIERTERHRHKWGFTKQQSDDGIIAVRSEDGALVLSTTWDSVHHLQANAQPAFRCIHANPYVGCLVPGETRLLRGCVLITAGDLTDAWEKTNQQLSKPQSKIGH